MKQFQFDYEGEDKFISMIKRIRQWCNASVVSSVLFQIYTENMNKNIVQSICGMIEKEMPKALYMGCSTNGNIILGDKSKGSISIVCTVYEYPSTKIEVLQYNLSEEKAKYVADSLTEYVARHPWVKSIMTYTTMRGMSMTDYCNYLCELPKNIVFCGGGAFSSDINDSAAFVFSNVGQISDHAAVFLMTGGEDYFVEALHVTGWKPLGRSLHVTKADGAVLYELDGKPAYETYYKYLNIKKDDNFFYNTLEFPFLYELNGMDILRAPTGCNSDGSLVMTADITEDVNARIAYGDPWTILDSVFDAATSFQEFIPETFTVFCPDYYTRIKIRDVNPSPPKVVRSRFFISYFCRKICEVEQEITLTAHLTISTIYQYISCLFAKKSTIHYMEVYYPNLFTKYYIALSYEEIKR